MRSWIGALCVCACVLALAPARLAAQPASLSGTAEARPWAADVSDAEQAKALELYVAGNHAFTESQFAQALAKYKEAIQHWDHPAIRYNMAVCLINLDQPVEARNDLELSLVYGAAPLGTAEYAQGLTYRKLLDAQLVRVKIVCSEAGTEVTLDGKRVMTAPGLTDQFLLPGTHQLVATKRGFLTTSRTFARVAGEVATLEIEPAREPAIQSRTVRRWAPWKPWTVVLSGGGVVGIGALAYHGARNNFANYDHVITMRCPHGCDAKTVAGFRDLHHTKSFAGTELAVAESLFSVGGAAVAAGVIGLILNQPRLQLAPVPTTDGAMVTMRWSVW